MISLTVRKPYLKFVDKQQLIATSESTLVTLLNKKPVDLAILICSDKEISRINLEYREKDQSTDVLSFESMEMNPDTGRPHLGDIVISYDSARMHSIQMSQDVQIELLVLLIHGILHLCGYDHATPDEKQQMWKKQYEIHRHLNISIDHLPGENE